MPDAPPPHAAQADWYVRRRRRRWPWVVLLVAALVAAAGGFLVHQRSATTGGAPAAPVPADPTAVVPAAPGERAGFALAGAGDAVVYLQTAGAIQRADLRSGASTLTPTPALVEPSSLFAGPGWVAAKTTDDPSGVLLPDAGTPQLLPVALQQAGRAYPGPAGGIWVVPGQADRNGGRTAVVVDVNGDRVGDSSIRVPGALGLPAARIGGSLLAVTAQGTYVAGPSGSYRLSRGTLLGTGTDVALTWDCNAARRCDARLDRPGKLPQYLPGVRTSLLGLYGGNVASAAAGRGVVSPDGTRAALELARPTRSGARLVVVELKSGHRVEVPGTLPTTDAAGQVAWTPNSRYLLALTDGRLRAFDATTDAVVTIGGTPAGLRHLAVPGTSTT